MNVFWNENKYKGLGRREKEKEFRRQAILSAAFDALLESSYSELTMSQIASKAELSAASLYLFFPNKRCLLAEMLLQIFESEMEPFRAQIEKMSTWEEQLETMFVKHLAFGSDDNTDFLYMLSDVFRPSDDDVPKEMSDRFIKCRGALLEILKEILDRAKKEDDLDFDTEYMAVTLVGGMEAMHHYSGLGMLSKAPTEFVADAVKLVKKQK